MESIVPIILSLLLSQSAPSGEQKLFPSLLYDNRCFSSVVEGSGFYQRWSMRFNAQGFLSVGTAFFSDSDCSTYSHSFDPGPSIYPYIDGGLVVNADGSEGHVLEFPNPENSDPYGTVYNFVGNQVCFAVGSITATKDSFSFSATDTNGDFSGQEIDVENCLAIIR